MSERYVRRAALPENLYTEGAPILIAAGALLEDTKTGKLLVQLKLRNIGQKPVREVVVRIVSLDMGRQPVGEPVEHRYQGLKIARGQEFAQKDPVNLPNTTARMAEVSVSRVVFADNSEWEAGDAAWTALVGTEALEYGLRSDELVEEYRLTYGQDCVSMPREEKDLWYCACGAMNHKEEPSCYQCGRALASLLAMDVAALSAQRAIRVEEAEKAAAAAAVEKAAKRKAGRKKGLIIMFLVLLLTAVIGIIVTKPDRVKDRAAKLAADGDLMGAVALLDELNRPEKTSYDRQNYLQEMEDEIWDAIFYGDYAKAMELIGKYTVLDTAEENIAYVQSVCEHDLEDTASQDFTCTEDGFDRKTCTVCGYVHEEIFPAPGHDFTSEITKESTCTEHGVEVFTCAVCNTTEKQELELLPHTYQTSVSKKPTCTETGISLSVCDVCGDSVEEPIDMVPHTNKESVVAAPTCTATGTKQTKCTVCGREESKVSIPALGHDHVKSVQTAVTCTADGVDLYTCSRCNDQYTKPVKSAGHSWNPATCTNPKTCASCGATEGSALGHKWYSNWSDISCTSCGQKWKTTIHLDTNLPYRYEDDTGLIRITDIKPTYSPILRVNTYGVPKISPKFEIIGKAYPDNEENPYITCSGSFTATLYDSAGNRLGSDSFFVIGADGSFSETVYFSFQDIYLENNGSYRLKIDTYE